MKVSKKTKYYIKYMTFWDYLAFACLAFLAVWFFLKIVGVINTPLWLQLSPLFGAVYVAGWGMSLLVRVSGEVTGVRHDLRNVEKDLRKEIHGVEQRLTKDMHRMELDVGILKHDVGILKNDVTLLRTRV
jgi:hypothetical protein